MKALEIVLSPGLGAKKACKIKWKLFRKCLDMDPEVASLLINHCRAGPWEGGAGTCSSPRPNQGQGGGHQETAFISASGSWSELPADGLPCLGMHC